VFVQHHLFEEFLTGHLRHQPADQLDRVFHYSLQYLYAQISALSGFDGETERRAATNHAACWQMIQRSKSLGSLTSLTASLSISQRFCWQWGAVSFWKAALRSSCL